MARSSSDPRWGTPIPMATSPKLSTTLGNANETSQLTVTLGREPRSGEVSKTLSLEKLRATPKAYLITMVEALTAGQQGDAHKLKYAELSMTEDLRKDYDALPQGTRNKIGTIKQLCDLFLVNRVMLAVASSILTLAPKDSSGTEVEDLETNLQYLTNVENSNGFATISGVDLLSSVLFKQHKYAEIQLMVASQNKGILVSDMSTAQIMEAFKAANVSYFASRASGSKNQSSAPGSNSPVTMYTSDASSRSASEDGCKGACYPAGQCVNPARLEFYRGKIRRAACRLPTNSIEYSMDLCRYSTEKGGCNRGSTRHPEDGSACTRIHYKETINQKWGKEQSQKWTESKRKDGPINNVAGHLFRERTTTGIGPTTHMHKDAPPKHRKPASSAWGYSDLRMRCLPNALERTRLARTTAPGTEITNTY
jgi:hypothetical protein